jgi:hypothetical protein
MAGFAGEAHQERESTLYVDVSESNTNQSSAKHFHKQFTMECPTSSNYSKERYYSYIHMKGLISTPYGVE